MRKPKLAAALATRSSLLADLCVMRSGRLWYGSRTNASSHFVLESIYCAISIEVSNYTSTDSRSLILIFRTGNIGNAKTLNANKKHDLLSETKMTNYQYVIALMVFLIAYAIFEVPSNYMLKKFSPSKWIAFLMFAWACITMGLGGVHNFATVTVLRFLLGVFEAGLFPGLVCHTNGALISLSYSVCSNLLFQVYYLTFWYRTEERSIRVALILASATLAGAFGGAIAYGVGHMDQVGGLAAFRWLFILEGLPSLLSAPLVWFCLPDYPETVTWLSPKERELALERLAVEGSKGDGKMTWADAKSTLTDWRLYIHYAVSLSCSRYWQHESNTFTIDLLRHLRSLLFFIPLYSLHHRWSRLRRLDLTTYDW